MKRTHCPFAGCPQHCKSERAKGIAGSVLCKHLKDCHQGDLWRLSDEECTSLDIFQCRICDEFVGKSEKALQTHIEKTHVEKRSATNLDIVTKHLYTPVSESNNNHWEQGLAFLRTLEIKEPPFRSSLISKVKGRLLDSVTGTAADIIYAINAASKEADSNNLRLRGEYDPTPIWYLLVLFEQWVLYPTTLEEGKLHSNSLNQEVSRRLRLFRSGQLEQLCKESRAVVSKTPKQQSESAEKIQKSAQAAADCDNFKSANARLTKVTPIAPVTDGEGGNIKVLEKLFPASLELPDHKTTEGRRTRGSKRNKKRVHVSTRLILKALRGLNKGKACDLQTGSLDLFIHLARAQTKLGKKGSKRGTAKKCQLELAEFFTHVVNGEVPPKVQAILRTTYLVALQKDPDDLSKLRPLGVPSAIRRVAAVLILLTYRAHFAQALLPFNYAIGINGGIDVITTTVRLGVDKFIRQPELKGKLPSRALVSLDIRNMFNAISRQKLREIMHKRFPELENFADMLYENDGRTAVKLVDGRWQYISVREGFAQGCPMSPVFAAIVLNEILSKLDVDLRNRALARKNAGEWGDDGNGGITISMAYIDDVNMLVPLADVEFVLAKVREYGEPLGAIMNTEKTRVLTSTIGEKTTTKLISSEDESTRQLGWSLLRAIAQYSTTIKDGERVPVEVTDGLRVLGAPIGSPSFCRTFIAKQMAKAKEASKRILEGLDSCQTQLQLYKTCTVHKMTHLFMSDVLAADEATLPDLWHLWNSQMTSDFDSMTNDFLKDLTSRSDMPAHAQLIASMASNSGGLGLQHPRCTAIPATVLAVKRCLEYATSGVWVGAVSPPVKLPTNITSLYENWQSSPAATFRIFQKYSNSMANICAPENAENAMTYFLYDAPPKRCKEILREIAANHVRNFVQHSLQDSVTAAKLGEILQRTTSLALLDMPRSEPCNRQKNDQWIVSLKRKLRLELWPKEETITCKCGRRMDHFGDHALSCTQHNKSAMSDAIRDGIIRVFKRILITSKLIDSPTLVEREPRNLIPFAKTVRPFDLMVRLQQLISDGSWRCPYSMLGFDVTVISSCASSDPSDPRAAPLKNSSLRLQEGEKKKYNRRGHTDKTTRVTSTGDELIGGLHDINSALIPITVNEFGEFGSLFNKFLYGTAALPLPVFDPETQRNAKTMAQIARSKKVPHGVLPRANAIWKKEHPDEFYGYSYKAMDPTTWAEQQLGLVTSTATANHILRAHGKVKTKLADPDERSSFGSLLKDGVSLQSIFTSHRKKVVREKSSRASSITGGT